MRRIQYLILILISFSSCLLPAGASVQKDEGRPTVLQVEVGKVTQAVFPSKIAKVVKGGVPDSVLVEVLDDSLYILPKTEDPSDIFVTTIAGSSYPLDLQVGHNHDIKVQIGSFKDKETFSDRSYYSDEMDLMKDLLLQKEPAGATVLPAGGRSFLSNHQIELNVEKAYELADWKAYVFIAKNLTNNALIIPVEQMSLPGLLAVSTDQDLLLARGQKQDRTRVYVIVGK